MLYRLLCDHKVRDVRQVDELEAKVLPEEVPVVTRIEVRVKTADVDRQRSKAAVPYLLDTACSLSSKGEFQRRAERNEVRKFLSNLDSLN